MAYRGHPLRIALSVGRLLASASYHPDVLRGRNFSGSSNPAATTLAS